MAAEQDNNSIEWRGVCQCEGIPTGAAIALVTTYLRLESIGHMVTLTQDNAVRVAGFFNWDPNDGPDNRLGGRDRRAAR